MNLGRRYAVIVALLASLIVVGWWTLRSPEAPDANRPVATVSEPVTQPLPATTIIAPPVTPDAATPWATLRGRVIDAATREPVREFELRFAEWGRTSPDRDVPATQKFVTQDGRFEWPRLPPGQWGIIAAAVGYQPFITDLQLNKGATTADVIVPLVRGYAIRGRVFDQASGAGIAGASITFHESGRHQFEGNFRLRPRAVSQAGGEFTLSGLPSGRITLSVDAGNYASRELDVTVDGSTPPVEIGLSGGGLISGRLTAADGVTAVTGATSLSLIGSSESSSTRTNEAGEFSFPDLRAGTYRLVGQGSGGSATREVVLAESERMEGVVLALRGGSTIRGSVTGLGPGELKMLSVVARPDPDSGASVPDAPALINERGEYELRDVPSGRMRVFADVNMRRQVSRTVDVRAGSDVRVDIEFPRGARVSGRVTQRGTPVSGVWLEPRPIEMRDDLFLYGARTAATGHYVIENVPPGEYTIRIDGYKSRPFQVAGDTVFDIDASPQLAGRIMEDNGKVPIADAQLDLWPADPSSSRIRATDRSDHYGRFAMAGLDSRDFVLTVYKPGYEIFRQRITYTSPLLDMAVRLSRGPGVEVRAHDAGSGKPLRALSAFEMIGDRNGLRLSVPLDERGLGSLPEGLAGATIAFGSEGYAPQTVRSWNGERLDLKFDRNPR